MRDVSSSPSRGGISSVTAGLASSAAVSSSSMPVKGRQLPLMLLSELRASVFSLALHLP